jgi:hypothetical protein
LEKIILDDRVCAVKDRKYLFRVWILEDRTGDIVRGTERTSIPK